ncbi:MAG TPA: acetylxylan esterase [Candidatus Bathyarchaeia archaeon]|nr:acetylxylan esterase [Candidatus Bathyarchaeia archaeon]
MRKVKSMQKVTIPFTVLILCGLASMAGAGQSKELDSDVNYDEGKVPRYDLPPLLVTAEGNRISTPEEWRTIRRPQILALFSNLVYGGVPEPESPIKTEFEVVKTDPKFMKGKATRKDVRIHFQNDKGQAEMLILVFVPNKASKPVPALMMHSFDNTRSPGFREHPDKPDQLRNGWPLGDFFDRGYGFVAVYQQDLVGHNEVEFQKGIHPLFYRAGQSFPKANEWGVLSAVAWGAMRAMDYLETGSDIDPVRVALMGHSKMGKATLWTAAQDERFALAISAQSGCAGAALWRRRSGETLEKMVTRFPYWLCRNAWKFTGQEGDLPVDQHMLLALIAPRPVYVYSGVEDTWADPRGEYLSAFYASEVYGLLGKTGLTSEASPPVGEAVIESDVGYHIREGGHSVERYDWARILEFIDVHFKEKNP